MHAGVKTRRIELGRNVEAGFQFLVMQLFVHLRLAVVYLQLAVIHLRLVDQGIGFEFGKGFGWVYEVEFMRFGFEFVFRFRLGSGS